MTPGNNNNNDKMSFNIDYRKLINDFLKYWWLFAITIPISLGIVFVKLRYTIPIYNASIKLLIEEKNNDLHKSDMMSGFVLTPGLSNVENQIALLTSRDMITKAINQLDFHVGYFTQGSIKTTENYPNKSYSVVFDSLHNQLIGVKFFIKEINKKQFKLSYNAEDAYTYNYKANRNIGSVITEELNEVFNFNEWITKNNFRFKIINNNMHSPPNYDHFFIFYNPNSIVSKYASTVYARHKDESSIVTLTISGANRAKNVVFLNTLANVFINNNLEQKNQIATNTINFIETQLIKIKDSLANTGTQLSNFRTKNKIQSISSQAEFLFNKLQGYRENLSQLNLRNNYYIYLQNYFSNDSIGKNEVIAPAVYEIENDLITNQIDEIIKLNTQRLQLDYSLGQNINPYSEEINTKFKLAVNTLIKSIKSQKEILKNEIERIEKEQAVTENRLYDLPETERKLLGIERKFNLDDEVFTFLLRKRSEAQIQKASNTSDHQILERARSGIMISPNSRSSYKMAFIIGYRKNHNYSRNRTNNSQCKAK